MHYDRQGIPITAEEWAATFNEETRRVKFDRLPNDFRVSTIWLGLDHQYGDGPPLIFETMVFHGERSADLDMERYSTLAEAEAGHARMVALWTPRHAKEAAQETSEPATRPDTFSSAPPSPVGDLVADYLASVAETVSSRSDDSAAAPTWDTPDSDVGSGFGGGGASDSWTPDTSSSDTSDFGSSDP